MTENWIDVHSEIYNGRNILIKEYLGDEYMPKYYCGYIETLDMDNMDQYKGYSDIPVDVHWMISFQGKQNDFSCVGWDCNHINSVELGYRNLDKVIIETKAIANQLDDLIKGVK